MLLPSKQRHHQLLVLALAIFVLSIYYFSTVSTSSITPYLESGYLLGSKTWSNPPIPAVEMEGLAIGPEFEEVNANVSYDDRLELLTGLFLDRVGSMGVDTSHPQCTINLARYESILKPSHSGRSDSKCRISIALNLYNSEDVLPSLSLALLEMIHYLQPMHQIYISVFENDSTDKTLELLGHLAAALAALNVNGITFRHSILTKKNTNVDRIVALANMRNEALLPLFPTAGDGIILFINDVVTCPSDLLELIHQTWLQDAHGAMSTDWFIDEGEPHFRDVWVARGINGEMPYNFAEPAGYTPTAPTGSWVKDLFITQEPDIHQRWVDGRPIPIYSGWNGAMALDAKLFTQYHVRFRASAQAKWRGGAVSGALGKWGQLLATPGYLESDCGASECKLFARDVWNILDGRARILLAPQSRTGYNLKDYKIIAAQVPATRRTGVEGSEELIDWSNVTIPAGVVCVPAIDQDGKFIDPWGTNNIRTKIDPRLHSHIPGLAATLKGALSGHT